MIQRPRFKACYHVEVVVGEGVFLLAEHDYAVLEGRLATQIAPLLDGQHTVDQITADLNGEASAAEVAYVLTLMERDGYLVEGQPRLAPEESAYWEGAGIDAEQAAGRLARAGVALRSLGRVDLALFRAALEASGVRVEQEAGRAVVVVDDYLHPDLADFNRRSWAEKQSWMLVKPVGKELWLGPVIVPGETACWACLAERLSAHRRAERFIEAKRGGPMHIARSRGVLASTLQTAYGMAVTEAARWIIQERHERLEGAVVSFDTVTLQGQRHLITRLPQCPVCGDGEATVPRTPFPRSLVSRKKRFTADGGHRVVAPEATFAAYKHHVSPITGVIRSLRCISPASAGLVNTYTVGHALGIQAETMHALRIGEQDPSAGKGMTDRQARTSGLCEGLERYSGIFRGDEPRITNRYSRLADAALHPNACMQFSQGQYQNGNGINPALAKRYEVVPEPFDEDADIEWSPAWSLTRDEKCYVPTAYCYYGYPSARNRYCVADSNGNAAGNTLEEAILQGFLELVERDSVALWWYNRLKKPRVVLESFEEPYVQALQQYYRSLRRELWVLDLTNDFGLPSFVALSRRIDRTPEDILLGFGCHLEARIALLRALTEVNQILPAVLEENPDGTTRYLQPDTHARTWYTTATLDNQPYLVPDEAVPPRTANDYPPLASDDLLEDVHLCLRLAEEKGLDVLVLDQTRWDIGLCVVKVMVPGLRHFWKRLGPGRLYDVPVLMGELREATPEQEMNPFPLFL